MPKINTEEEDITEVVKPNYPLTETEAEVPNSKREEWSWYSTFEMKDFASLKELIFVCSQSF